ncbi:MAG: D-alanine--D-alanine ligase [Candidatus Nomurabacteria bacterium]|nr:D-alanine--D-alanine ligase [Candidatus Nomurabacteria bacterium]
MIHVSNSLPDIAVLRGGNVNFKKSLAEGGEVLQSLIKIGYNPIDVLIDEEGNWTASGMPTDAHTIFTRSHTVVDTTRMKKEKYQELAKNMGISLIFSHDDDMTIDREGMYRILRQKGFKVPETIVVRSSFPIKPEIFRKIWSTYHTPLMVRPLESHTGEPSKIVKLFQDLEKTVRDYHEKGIDVHVLTYKKSPTTSIALIPNFRGEKIYTPVWVETFGSYDAPPNENSPMRAHMQAPDFRKKQVWDFATNVYQELGLNVPVCIDMVPYKEGYIVVNIDTHPSLRNNGRFMQSLLTTGVDAGQYIHSRVKEEYGI